MRLALGLILLTLVGCGDGDSESSGTNGESTAPVVQQEEAIDFIVTNDTSLLLYLTHPNLTLTDSSLVEEDSIFGDTTGTDYALSYAYELYEGQLASATVVVESSDAEQANLHRERIHQHLSKWSLHHSRSASFENWLLPLYGRPLIEISAFYPSETKTRLKLYIRQYM